MTSSTVRPCAFPGCADLDGNPVLTGQTICPASRRRYRRVLDWLAEDYTLLHAELSHLRTGARERVAESKVYGHPAEHISIWKRRIAEVLNTTHEALADHRGDLPPPDLSGHSEARLVALAHRYLTVRFDALCTFPVPKPPRPNSPRSTAGSAACSATATARPGSAPPARPATC